MCVDWRKVQTQSNLNQLSFLITPSSVTSVTIPDTQIVLNSLSNNLWIIHKYNNEAIRIIGVISFFFFYVKRPRVCVCVSCSIIMFSLRQKLSKYIFFLFMIFFSSWRIFRLYTFSELRRVLLFAIYRKKTVK